MYVDEPARIRNNQPLHKFIISF
jgi:hypothetical protein